MLYDDTIEFINNEIITSIFILHAGIKDLMPFEYLWPFYCRDVYFKDISMGFLLYFVIN